MKLKRLCLTFIAIGILSSCNSKTKKINLCISPDANVRYAYYLKCVEDGCVVVLTEEKPELGNYIEKFVLSDGTIYYFYPAKGYEFV